VLKNALSTILIVLVAAPICSSYAADPVTTAYMKDQETEAKWALFVKDSFSPAKIKVTCGAYKPAEYPACFFRFVSDTCQKKKLSTSGVTLIAAVGIMVDVNTYNDSIRDPASSTDKTLLNFKKFLDISELSLTLLEKDQAWRKTDKYLPAGPDADKLLATTKATDDKFQIVMLQKVGETLSKSSTFSCRENKSCPDLEARYQGLNKMYARLKAAGPKS
jgi:hypothetical protein